MALDASLINVMDVKNSERVARAWTNEQTVNIQVDAEIISAK